jgi:hypothetical protein
LEASDEVVLDRLGEGKKKEIGISGWLKSPKKKKGRPSDHRRSLV